MQKNKRCQVENIFLSRETHQGKSLLKKQSKKKFGDGERRGKEMNSSLIPAGCDVYAVFGGRLDQPSQPALAALIFIIIIHFLTFPFTAVLNALVMLAVKIKPRLRAHKSNILLALLASTDFLVGVAIQPVFIALITTDLLDETSSWACSLQVFTRAAMSCLCDASLIHVALISGERYLAMKHSFAYATLVTEARLLFASAMGWLLSVTLHIPLAVDKTVFFPINNTFIGISIALAVFCHVTVYVKPVDMSSNLQLNKLHKRQGNNLKETKRRLS